MTGRLLLGKNTSSGAIGFWVSKAGFDVRTAGIMQMAFSSDFACPNLVATGSVICSPISGYAPNGNSPVPGAHVTNQPVYYGRTISPAPFVAAIASAPGWPCPTIDLASQLGYLAGQWHTFIWERPPDMTGRTAQSDTTYGTGIRPATTNNAGDADITFSSSRFTMAVFTDRVEFSTNCYYPVTVKYVILEQ